MAKNYKKQSKLMTVALVVAIMVGLAVLGNMAGLFDSEAAPTGAVTADGEPIAPWATKLVNYNLLVTDAYTSANVAASVKVYDKQPDEWNNPLGNFDKSAEYTEYVDLNADGTILIDKEYPSTYYAVIEMAGYNTVFETFTIPDGEGQGNIADYQSNPDSTLIEMAAVATTTSEDIAFTLANETDATEEEFVSLKVSDDAEAHLWKATVEDILGFSEDFDSDSTFDEGISSMTVTVGSKSMEIFNPAKGIDLFDSNDKYSIDLTGIVVADGAKLDVEVEIVADTSDSAALNDELLGEGDGTIVTITILDTSANTFATVNAVA